MATKRRSIGFFGCIIVSCLAACSSSCDSRKTEQVEISKDQFNEWYRDFQIRFLLWERQWQIPHYETPFVGPYDKLHFFEFRSTETSTCYFKEPDIIQIGDDKWQSGCVPHEIGHAVLYLIGHPCWGEFEHEAEKEKCLKRFK